MSLRPRRVLGVLGKGAAVFSMLEHPSALQEHLRKGYKYFPDDVNPVGTSLLEVCPLALAQQGQTANETIAVFHKPQLLG
jgi:hypothetical protein